MALAGLVALVWAGSAFAQATSINTPCPTSFTCAFNSAETLALSTPSQPPKQPGAPNVYIGYLSFDSSNGVTLAMVGMLNGTVQNQTLSGTCASGKSGAPALINFTNGPQWAFVTVNSAAGSGGEELDFILTQDVSGAQPGSSNAVRVGVCRSPAP